MNPFFEKANHSDLFGPFSFQLKLAGNHQESETP